MEPTWTIKSFKDLTLDEFHDLIRLRVDVFVVEQACPYPELDGKDRHRGTRHIWTRGPARGMAACARLLPPGASYPGASLGRVAVARECRRRGLARKLVAAALASAETLWPGAPVQIGAQAYLEDFYISCGFRTMSEAYLEDGIPHIDMTLNRT